MTVEVTAFPFVVTVGVPSVPHAGGHAAPFAVSVQLALLAAVASVKLACTVTAAPPVKAEANFDHSQSGLVLARS